MTKYKITIEKAINKNKPLFWYDQKNQELKTFLGERLDFIFDQKEKRYLPYPLSSNKAQINIKEIEKDLEKIRVLNIQNINNNLEFEIDDDDDFTRVSVEKYLKNKNIKWKSYYADS